VCGDLIHAARYFNAVVRRSARPAGSFISSRATGSITRRRAISLKRRRRNRRMPPDSTGVTPAPASAKEGRRSATGGKLVSFARFLERKVRPAASLSPSPLHTIVPSLSRAEPAANSRRGWPGSLQAEILRARALLAYPLHPFADRTVVTQQPNCL